jgi:lysophospholipase L1-like esterase
MAAMALGSFALASVAGAQFEPGETLTYVAFGDSITQGEGDNIPEDTFGGYPTRLEQLLINVEVINRGFGGETTVDGLKRLDVVLAEQPVHQVLLMEGANDVSRRIPLEATLFNLDQMARKALGAGAGIAHATLIPRLPHAKVDPESLATQELNQEIRHLAGLINRTLIDPAVVFSQLPRLFDDYYSPNPEDTVGHPNAVGYDVMALVFAQALLHIDRVPPVPGLLDPNNGDVDVPPLYPIRVDVWDFLNGINLDSVELSVGGEPVDAVITGDTRRASLTYIPESNLDGRVLVRLRAADLANPPNVFDAVIADFVVEGSDLPTGDLDHNGKVNNDDVKLLGNAFGSTLGSPRYRVDYDLNSDDVIDGYDLALLAHNFGASI